MIYYLRLFIILILVVPYIVYKHIKKKKIKIWVVLVLLLISIIIVSIQFETKILKMSFDKVEDAFNYSFISEDILRTIDTENGTFVVYGHECDIDGYTFISKIDDKYTVVYPNRKINETITSNDEYELHIETFEDNNLVHLITDNIDKEPTHGLNVGDNKGSAFTYYFCKHKREMNYQEGYYTIIDDVTDYQVNIDGNILELK